MAVLLVCPLAVGCVSSPPGEGGDEAATALASLSFAGCEQTHTFVPYPVEAFAGMLPPGWTLQPADDAGRTTQFYLSGSRCATAQSSLVGRAASIEELKEVWGYLFVVPPEGVNESFDGELWPLGAVVSHGDAWRIYAAWGFAEDLVVEGRTEISFTSAAPGVLMSWTWSNGGEETFEVGAVAQATSGPFHAGAFRVWIPADGEDGIAGAILYAWPEGGVDLGVGAGTLRYEGPLLNAPPATQALVHHVRDVSGNVTLLPG